MDNLLFYMPHKLEEFLPAMAAVQSLCDQLEKQKRPNYVLTIVAERNLTLFRPAFKNVILWSDTESEIPYSRNYDMVFKFDRDEAYKLAVTSKMHIAKAFGVSIGADPVNDYPTVLGDLSNIPTTEPTKDVLIWNVHPTEMREALVKFCAENGLSSSQETWGTIREAEVGDLFKVIADHRMLVGARSGGSYLANSLKRKVVEIYPTDYHKNWLSKWANPYYFMVYEDAPSLTVITRAMQVAWNRRPEWAAGMASSASMGRR